jgi:carboxymethylenebutenolidase
MSSSIPPPYVQYQIRSGFLQVKSEEGDAFGAFSAQPVIVRRFPGVVLMHDWWGLNANLRFLTDQLAQAGFVVIAPDLFDGQKADTPAKAQELMAQFRERRAYRRLLDCVEVLRQNHNTGSRVGVVGVGLGGGFAFKAVAQGAAIHAAVAAPGFPQHWLGKLSTGAAVMALFGAQDPLIPAEAVEALRTDLGTHGEVIRLPALGHDLWPDDPTGPQAEQSLIALRHIAHFLHQHLDDGRAH